MCLLPRSEPQYDHPASVGSSQSLSFPKLLHLRYVSSLVPLEKRTVTFFSLIFIVRQLAFKGCFCISFRKMRKWLCYMKCSDISRMKKIQKYATLSILNRPKLSGYFMIVRELLTVRAKSCRYLSFILPLPGGMLQWKKVSDSSLPHLRMFLSK